MKGRLLPVLACLILGACEVGEDYQRAPLGIDDRWEALDPNNPLAAKNHAQTTIFDSVQPPCLLSPIWWERFDDPQLNQLMQRARLNNNDLKVAKARIAEAMGNARVAGSALLPQVNASASFARTGVIGPSASALSDNVSQLGIGATWDIDIFGGDRRAIEAADAEVEATQADHDRVQLQLDTDVSTNYVQLRSLQQQRALTVKNLAMQKDTLKVTLAQRKEGAISDLEVARAKAQVESTRSRLPQIDTATVAALNRLSVLTGEAPNRLNADLTSEKPIPLVPTMIVVATPIRALERRPDIQASERRFAEATALTGAAVAQLYPKISLQTFFGSQYSHLYGYSTPANITASALMPLLDWGRIHGAIDAADARQQQAYYTYQQTVLLAVEQIENAVTSYINEQQRLNILIAADVQQRKATEVAREQYKVGATTQLDLLTAENSQLDTDSDLTASTAALANDLIQLYTALGETWQPLAQTPLLPIADQSMEDTP